MNVMSVMKGTPDLPIPVIPVLPRSRLYLVASGHGDEPRFARIFRATWRCLPPEVRRLLLRYWRTDGRGHLPQGPVPRIQLSGTDLAQKRKLLGQFLGDGHELLFHAAMVDRMPEDVVAGLVAHELAHVVLLAKGDRSRGELCEYRADGLVHSWGFEPSDIDEWYLRHVRRWDKRGIRWHDPPLTPEQVVGKVEKFVPGNKNGRYVTSRGWPIIIDDAA